MYKLVVLLFLFSSVVIFGQMPPHPKLLDKIKSGLIDVPYLLKNIEKYREKGIDAAWRDESLNKLQADNLTSSSRNFGALSAPSGNWNALALVVEFSDNVSITEAAFFDNLLFEQEAGSMWDYFKEVSYGNLDIVTVNLPGSVDWISAPSTYDYYTAGDYGMGDYPRDARRLVEDVVQLVDHLVDYSKYDNDNDGDVDALMIIHSGPGAEYTGDVDDIWSHMWSTKNAPRLDGVWITRYSIQPEYFNDSGDMTIGVYCHELGHSAFGLPDLYDTDNSSAGLGYWSLMAGGSWNGNSGDTPAFPDAYNHIQMGYVDPVIISSNVNSQSIYQVETNAEIYKLYPNGTPGDEYFLIENRQKVGYDSGLRSGGLHIYHVDESVNSKNDKEWYPGFTSSGHYMVALEQADGLWELEKNKNDDAGDVFPGSTQNRTFDFNSTPGSRNYNDEDTDIAITNISNSQSVMTADFELFQSLVLTSPNGGENWSAGTEYEITWTSVIIENISIEYSTDNGNVWIDIEGSYPASNQNYSWEVPETPSGQCLVKLSDANDETPADQSDNVFIISSEQAELYNISGNVIYNRSGVPIEFASVGLYQGIDRINTAASSVDGSYNFNDIPPGSYSLRTEKSFGWGGNFASDALEVALYEVNPGSTFLPDELSKVAGWVTKLGTEPSSADALSILNRSVNMITSYAISDWQFIDYDITIGTSDVSQDVEGICAGDARSDYDPSGALAKSSITMTTEEVLKIRRNSEFELPIKLVDAAEVGSFTIELRYPMDKLKVVGVKPVSGTLVSNVQDDVLSIAWADLTGKNALRVEDDGAIAIITFKASETFVQSEKVALDMLEGGEITDKLAKSLDGSISVPVMTVGIPDAYSLSQNYPNPFNPSTTIKYELPVDSKVMLVIYNVLGEEVSQLVNAMQESGSYEIEWNASDFVSGVYLFRMTAGNPSAGLPAGRQGSGHGFTYTKKMLYVK